jgi:hypothetical protein
VLVQLGPVQNIDRLAGDHKLRMAAVGITLVYGENGSGKSGYTRIAKRLCRSLTADQLRGNVFDATGGPMRVHVRYKVGDDTVTDIEWDPATPAPSPDLSFQQSQCPTLRRWREQDRLPSSRNRDPRAQWRTLPAAGREALRGREGPRIATACAASRGLHLR